MGDLFIVVGLGFGDEGKGSTVDFLARKHNAKLVIRFNGGSQPTHNVVVDNIHHCFSQFGSATLFNRTKTHISKQMLIDPITLINEAQCLKSKGIYNPFELLSIDPDSVVITQYHKILSRIKEMTRKEYKHGTTGMGVGDAYLDYLNGKPYIKISDLFNHKRLKSLLGEIFSYCINECLTYAYTSKQHEEIQLFFSKYSIEYVFDSFVDLSKIISKNIIFDEEMLSICVKDNISVIMEGCQGALLDPNYGFIPYVTKIPTIYQYALDLINDYKSIFNISGIGVTRCYSTRHGYGPLVSEDNALNFTNLIEDNLDNQWQGKFRVGWLDLIALDYAIQLNPDISSIFLTNVDRIECLSKIKIINSYIEPNYIVTPKEIKTDLGCVVKINKPTSMNKHVSDYLIKCTQGDHTILKMKNFWWLDIVNIIEDKLNKPVNYISKGPKNTDKFMLKT